jgi:hypothetical protein
MPDFHRNWMISASFGNLYGLFALWRPRKGAVESRISVPNAFALKFEPRSLVARYHQGFDIARILRDIHLTIAFQKV